MQPPPAPALPASPGSATAPAYEGKAKRVTLRPDGLVELRYKDDATAFNGQKREQFAEKGVLNSQISELLFRYVESHGIPTHSRGRLDERTLLAASAKMFALEAVVRFKVAGSLRKRTGLPEGTLCTPPIVEFYYKRDDLGDPLLNDAHIRMLQLATPAELAVLTDLSLRTAGLLHELCARGAIDLVDMKFEFGRVGSSGDIVLCDEISPDTCRFRDAHTGHSLDKDRFREDTGDLIDGYREALARLQAALAHS
jgi:phosphoribosylaminoimidazole-succinocarboxamide synthase